MAKEMQRDEIYPIAGYDVLARIRVTEGGGPPWRQDVVILNNNSTHHIVGWSEGETNPEFVFVKSFRYGASDEFSGGRMYHEALNLAVELAKEN